ncbi:hypothetical protein GCM10010124_07290 [Pilimelia terevasa]|uniref:Streptogrisin C n=1 Tax=Pilimelia terevasa TaxID=53372 RepID=A0A8J3BNV7_9ACTN|nr:S1 family peptidase [Pilimelia terevasa]GGK17292.1 hypothetical protein GCM10010124_07290 [Pilimelia terevasa]
MDRRQAVTSAVCGVVVAAAAAVTVPALAAQERPRSSKASPYVQLLARDMRMSEDQAQERVDREAALGGVGAGLSENLGNFANASGGGLPGVEAPGADAIGQGVDAQQIADLVGAISQANGGDGDGGGGFDPALIAQIAQLGSAAAAANGGGGGAGAGAAAGNVDPAQAAAAASSIAGLISAFGGGAGGGAANGGGAGGGAAGLGVPGVFAGTWIDKKSQKLKVGITDPDAASAVRRAGAEPKLMTYNAAQLATVKADLDQRARAIAPASAASWYVDPASNSVVVLAAPGQENRARRWALKNGAPADSVRITRSTVRPRPLVDVRGADPFLVNNLGRCSVGFAVRGGFVSAGHCGQDGAKTSAGAEDAFQGTFAASSFPGDDYSFVRTASTFTPTSAVATERGDINVTGSREMPVGASVCRSGSTTGTRCGLILAKNATVNYAEGAVTGLTQTDVCAEPGDSGGPFVSGSQAQGITSGGSGDCVAGGSTFFQPVNEPLQRLNLTLLTSTPETAAAPSTPQPAPTTARPAAQPSEADTPPAAPTRSAVPDATEELPRGGTRSTSAPAACADPDVSYTGTLVNDGVAIEPEGRSYRAEAGTQTVCLTGPADANFDVAVQKWSGLKWDTVASGTSADAAETVRVDGTAGLYRIEITAEEGTGGYTVDVG